MKRSNRYWQNRAEQRMYEYIYNAEKDADLITKAYLQSSNYLSDEAQKVLKTFERDNGLSEAEARRILNRLGVSAPLQRYVDAPAYAYRIRRLEALREDIDRQCQKLYGITNTGITKILQNTVENGYSRTMFDIQKGTSFGFSFSVMSTSRVNEILRQNWSGEHYSKRIWDNVDKLADTLKEEVLVGFMTGRSVGKTANAIQERMGCGSMEARRIARTETNYVANQAELDSYRECGVDRYRFIATLDSRTSEICQRLDGKVFPVNKAKAGGNLPPMHPNCRSTTVAVFEDEIEEGLMRRARDPLTGETELVPADMTYEQWKKKFVNPAENVAKSKENGIIELELTDNAKRAIQRYMSAKSYEINEILRTKAALTPENQKFVDELDSALEKLPAYEGDLKRSLYFYSEQEIATFMEKYPVGSRITYNEYISATKGNVYNPDGQVQIYIRNAKHGKDISDFNKAEDEILYQRGSAFKVVEIIREKDKYFICLEEIDG